MTLVETLTATQSRADSLSRIYAFGPLAGDVADDVITLLSAVRNVLALHTPFEWSFGYGPVQSCRECARLGASESDAQWPCATYRVLTDALEGGE
jgi:hypothetical protein